jgi:hypothetical protein
MITRFFLSLEVELTYLLKKGAVELNLFKREFDSLKVIFIKENNQGLCFRIVYLLKWDYHPTSIALLQLNKCKEGYKVHIINEFDHSDLPNQLSGRYCKNLRRIFGDTLQLSLPKNFI